MSRDMFFQSQELDQLATALSLAQGEIKDADKSSVNPHLKSKYADLAEVLQTVRPVLSKHGLSVVQGVSYSDKQVHVKTRLLHKSGQYIEDMISIPIQKEDAQGVGSGTTYGRRYGLAAMLGISQDDDDGESIKTAKGKQEPRSAPQNQVPENPASLVLGPIAKEMIAKFEQARTESQMKFLTTEYAVLTPVEQTQVLPAAKAARIRLEEAKSSQTQ